MFAGICILFYSVVFEDFAIKKMFNQSPFLSSCYIVFDGGQHFPLYVKYCSLNNLL